MSNRHCEEQLPKRRGNLNQIASLTFAMTYLLALHSSREGARRAGGFKNKMILIYAFSNPWGTNISHLTLLELQKTLTPVLSKKGVGGRFGGQGEIVYQLIHNYPQEFFRKYIQGNQYDLIIGLGDSPSDKIRIETQTKNSYNDKSIYPFSPILIDLNLPNLENFDSNVFSISSNMGTYNCNWMAYSTQLYLNQKSPSTYHIFLHLPKKANATSTAFQIKNLFESNRIFLSLF